jgi:hypothetical protein
MMSDFKQYVQDCARNRNNIKVNIGHLDSITMEDICMLIHIMSVKKLEVILSQDVKHYLEYDYLCMGIIFMANMHNKEELAILMYLHKNPVFPPKKSYDLYTSSKANTRYAMSDNFLVYAKQCDVSDYSMTEDICKTYCIKYQNTPTNQYFEQYMSTGPKSARNV